MIEYTLRFGGSGNGITSLLPWFGCQKRAAYDERIRVEFSNREHIHLDKSGLNIGTLYHAFLELYFSQDKRYFDPTKVVFKAPNSELSLDDELRYEAERIFLHYQEKYPVESTGGVMEIEKVFPGNNDSLSEFLDKTFTYYSEEHKSALPIKLTAQIDKITVLSSPNQFNLPSGVYSWDYKQHGRHESTLADQYLHSLQGKFYGIICQQIYKDKYKGHIFDVCIRNKEPKFFPIFQEQPNEVDLIYLQKLLGTAMANRTSSHIKEGNPLRCFDWGKACQYLDTSCDRI